MLHAALRLTDHARADIVAIDTSAALAAPGVVAVFTAADMPGDLRVGIIHKDWPVMIPVGGPRRARATCSPSSSPRPASRRAPRPTSSR